MLRQHPTANGSASGVGARTPWGWAGSVPDFVNAPYDHWAASLEAHHLALNGEAPSTSQRDAWRDEWDVLAEALCKRTARHGVSSSSSNCRSKAGGDRTWLSSPARRSSSL